MMNEMTTLLPHIKLRFHVDNPSLEECYVYGYECAQADITEQENPYLDGSQENEQWAEGWWAGFYNEQPLFSFEAEAQSDSEDLEPVNDPSYHNKGHDNYFFRVLEIAGVIAVSAIIGYQVIDIVA